MQHIRHFLDLPLYLLRRTSHLLFLLILPLGAQEVSVGLGQLHPVKGDGQTYSWQIQYLQPLSPQWSVSLTWLNEGHLEDHHRDGFSLQLWRFHKMEHNHLRLGLGLGTYRYFDTTDEKAPTGYQNQHGFKPLLSLRAQYPLTGGWDGFLQVNRTAGEGDPQTQGILLGLSHRFGSPASGETPPQRPREERNSLTFLAGRTILNSFASQSATAYAIEYRRKLLEHLEATVAYSDEGDTSLVDRDGLALQLWGVTDLGQDGWGIGFGVGPYFSRLLPKETHEEVELKTSLRVTMGLYYRISRQWVGRLHWNRTLTHYHRDTDVMLAGFGYNW